MSFDDAVGYLDGLTTDAVDQVAELVCAVHDYDRPAIAEILAGRSVLELRALIVVLAAVIDPATTRIHERLEALTLPGMPLPPGHKQCTNCGHGKPHEEFPPDKKTRDGLASWCRECKAVANRERRERARTAPAAPPTPLPAPQGPPADGPERAAA
jgi:hypothetical protein